MNSLPKQYTVALTDAERILAQCLASFDGSDASAQSVFRPAVRQFLSDLSEPYERGPVHLILNEARLLRWMLRSIPDYSPEQARKRLGAIGRYHRALVAAGLVEVDLLAEFRAHHDHQPWRVIVEALQSEDPGAALAALRPEPRVAGPLEAQLHLYLELQQSLGKECRKHRIILKRLDCFLKSQGIVAPQAVTSDLIERWLDTMTCRQATRVGYVRLVGRFFDHLGLLGVVARNPVVPILLGAARPARVAFRPFLFTREQVTAVLAKAQQLPVHPRFPLRGLTCYTMLVLLYALGLRHGEVRRLRFRDLDAAQQTLFIHQTKFHKSRYVPFGPRLGQRLQQFVEARRTMFPPLREDDLLFVTRSRKLLDSHMLLDVFQAILGELRITRVERRPRLHDLRHTFAVHRLLRWYREGIDVQSRLPLLATFMGHVEARYTEVYLTVTAELLQEANGRFHRHFGCLFEEVVE